MLSDINLHQFGTNLPTLQFDEVPSKKPINVQDQIVTDEHGRRRFHGAFTGGFSAGYWNTVGSKEGWTPQAFKSSRSEKNRLQPQKPEDFMDEEDHNEFGNGSKGLTVSDDFEIIRNFSNGSQKRKLAQTNYGPIPGEPVLKKLIKLVKNTISVRILQKWGWRSGQGIGARQTTKEKKMARNRNLKEQYLFEKYGYELSDIKPQLTIKAIDDGHKSNESSNEDDDSDENITFAPEDYDIPPCNEKNDLYGMGYKPLNANSYDETFSKRSQFESGNSQLCKTLEVLDKKNKKISFTGHAFGIGALEDDDDDDVYSSYDMTNYDFSLDDKKTKTKKAHSSNETSKLVLDFFILEKTSPKYKVYNVDVPFGWQPKKRHKRRSRFEDISQTVVEQLERNSKLLPKPSAILQEPTDEINLQNKLKIKKEELHQQQLLKENKTKMLMEKISMKTNNFVKGGIINMEGKEMKSIEDITQSDGCGNESFKPFLSDIDKQTRYEKFLSSNLSNDQEIETFIYNLQPKTMSSWEKQLEVQEFKHARKLYKSRENIMSDRFTREIGEKIITQDDNKQSSNGNKQIIAVRTKGVWKPHTILCKRYNIPDPYVHLDNEDFKEKKKSKLSVFDYLGESYNKKDNFETPVIIPKFIEKSAVNAKEKEKKNEEVSSQKDTNEKLIEKNKETMVYDTLKNEPSHKPKSDLEQSVIQSIDKLVSEKKDLFSSIFQDSESEDDEAEPDESSEVNEINNKSLEKDCEKDESEEKKKEFVNNMQAGGIFKWLFTKAPKQCETNINTEAVETPMPKILFQKKKENTDNIVELPGVYGPSLPKEKDTVTNNANISKDNFRNIKLAENQFGEKCVEDDISDEWVEKKHNVNSSSSSSSISDCESKRDKGKSLKRSSKKKKKKRKKKKTDYEDSIENGKERHQRKKHKKKH